MSEDLPAGWELTTLGTVVESQKGKVPKKFTECPQDGFVPYIDIEAFETGRIKRYATDSGTTIATENDVFVVWDGARFGLAGKFPGGALFVPLIDISTRPVTRESQRMQPT
ncbi:MAG: restriction endonuclease subunit S [Parvibaculum sp.]|nr:restriction endonuclease subunit S [Parvibaculum sp.]